jgi:hypothetical protein
MFNKRTLPVSESCRTNKVPDKIYNECEIFQDCRNIEVNISVRE